MSHYDLSILIPSRNEMFLNQTLQSIWDNRRGATEVIVVLDGGWPVEPVPDNERLTLVYHPESVGQRAATNEAARMARGWYVMKLDAHCAVDEGFDVKMLEAFAQTGDDVTMVPIMRNLHVFDWVCPNGHRRYQGPSGPCKECGEPTERDIVWIAKHNPQSTSYCFDAEPHFQYFRAFKKRPEGKGDITETMSLQGSCWMMTKKQYFDLDVCDELWGTWGSQGIEVACKTWLSGGRCLVNHRTWYAHCFRTQGGDFGFPYPLSGKQVRHAKNKAREIFFNNQWDRQVRPLSWLVERFWPVPGWTDDNLATIKQADPQVGALVDVSEPEAAPSDPDLPSEEAQPMTELTKGIVYYTDNRLDPLVMAACQRQLERSGLPIACVSLEPMDFGDVRIVVDGNRGPLTMFRQILAGLEALDVSLTFFAEHDIIYHVSHWEFEAPRDNLFYYNNNLWKVDLETGRSLFHFSNHTSQLCAYRELMLEHYRKRVAMVEANGFSRRMGYEPGTHGRAERVDDYKCDTWMSEQPNLDIRHSGNLTQTRWKKEQFRNQRFTKGWTESDHVRPWYETDTFEGLLEALT